MSRRRDMEAEVARSTKATVLGRFVEWHDVLGSTNERARELAREHAAEGTTVVADEQTHGRGRMGHVWFSPAAGGLWFSIILYPTQSMATVPGLTVMVAEAVRSFLDRELGIRATLKEPNDLLVGGKKICGILAEASTAAGADTVDFVVVGVGLNLTATFEGPLATTATAAAVHAPRPLPPRTELLGRFLGALEERYLL